MEQFLLDVLANVTPYHSASITMTYHHFIPSHSY